MDNLFLWVFLAVWAGWIGISLAQKWSKTIALGGGFLTACILTLMVFASGAYLDKHGSYVDTPPVAETAAVVPQSKVKSHNYSLKDGVEYGYERAVSVEEANKGQAAASLLMAKFVGIQDGKYQVMAAVGSSPNTVVVVECTNPCEFIKNMVYYQGQMVSSQRIRVTPDLIAWLMLEDAINGHLEQYIKETNGKKFFLWFDETKGVIKTEIPPHKE
ncbi:MAG: hypothetical protein PHP85_14605 [Gallionella sp.]|nr:hypothetical protein [Gallionella sp.]